MAKPDYKALIEPDVWAYIDACAEFYPADAVNFSIEQQRAYYTALCKSMALERPEGLTSQDKTVAGVATRWYDPGVTTQKATLVYFHGGGWVVGNLDSHDDICAELADTLGMRVVAVDYRMAPEVQNPAAEDDCFAVTQALLAEGRAPLMLMGDSAGGYIAAVVSHRLRDHGRSQGDLSAVQSILGQVLIYPSLGGDPDKGSYLEQAEAPMLTRADMRFYSQAYFGGDKTADRPLAAQDFADLPATFAITGPFDPLYDDGPAYAAALEKSGVPARFVSAEGLPHSFLRARRRARQAEQAWQAILDASRNLLEGRAP